MATKFEDIRGFMRTALGDTDEDAYCYPDEVLNSHIRLSLMVMNDQTIQENGRSEEFTADLLPNQQALVIYKSARGIIAGTPDHFSWRTPVLSIVRERGASTLRSYYDQILTKLEGRLSVASSLSDLDEMVQGTLRYTLAYSRSLAKVPQYTNPKL